MTNRQITEMMRDIAPQYQNKANERAASVQHAPRRSVIPQLLAGGAALSCAAFALAFIVPNMQQSGLTQPDSQIENLEEITENDAAGSPENAPFGNLSDKVIRLASPAYAPYALELADDVQQNLAEELSKANWLETATVIYDEATFTDGESVIVNIYDPYYPLCMIFSGQDNVVRVTDFTSDNWRVFETSKKAVRAVRNAAETAANAPAGKLTWVRDNTLTTPDFWKNFRVDAKVCNMSDKADVFYKMTNPMDYYDCVSGVVMSGGEGGYACGGRPASKYFMQKTAFQLDLNMCKAVNTEECYFGDSIDELIRQEGAIFRDDPPFVSAMDGQYEYFFFPDDNKYTKYELYGRRIDALPTEDTLSHDVDLDVDSWCSYNNRIIGNGIGMESLYNIGTVTSYLNNFNNWDIVGTEEVNGRTCVHIQGHAPEVQNELVFFKDSAMHVTHFDIYADEATGVIVRLRGYDDNENVTRFIETTDLVFDDDVKTIVLPDFSMMEEETFDDYPEVALEAAEGEEAAVIDAPVTDEQTAEPSDTPAEAENPEDALKTDADGTEVPAES